MSEPDPEDDIVYHKTINEKLVHKEDGAYKEYLGNWINSSQLDEPCVEKLKEFDAFIDTVDDANTRSVSVLYGIELLILYGIEFLIFMLLKS